MVDFKSYFMSLKASWVYRLVNGKFANWKLIPFKYLKVSNNILSIFNMNLDDIKHLEYFKCVPEFYREVIKSWILTGGGQTKQPVTYADIRKHTIWGNKFITFHNKPIIFENWIKSDIIYLNDILDATMSLSAGSII